MTYRGEYKCSLSTVHLEPRYMYMLTYLEQCNKGENLLNVLAM